MDLKYIIADIECLEDYFCLQVKDEIMDDVVIWECYTDEDCIQLYKTIQDINERPFYFYSIDYDRTMINALCKLVENDIPNILYHLRKINDFLIQKNIHYFKLNREYWGYHYAGLDPAEQIKLAHPNELGIHEFIDSYQFTLGKSKVFKGLIINEIPKILFYYNIDIKGNIKPSISLKSLNLIKKGFNIKFDFSKYQTIAKIKADGLYDKWIEYSKNDVLFLEELFNDKCRSDIEKRFWAFQAAKSIDNTLELLDRDLYAENNTGLIVSILKLDKPNKNISIDYTKYITTPYSKFNEFVKFVSDNNDVEKDKDLKNGYCEHYKREYIDDDVRIENDTLIGSFDEIEINGTLIKIGLGGGHGAIDHYSGVNLRHLDYQSQYSSIMLQYKELFSNIINIPLYEAIYDLKNITFKNELKQLDKEIEEMCNIINDGGCDGADIWEYSPQIDEKEDRKTEINNLIGGVKLILNTTYGLINSNFTLPISCKVLGRFICLKGQSMLLNLAYKLTQDDPDLKLVNLNTDGIIVETKLPIAIENDGYFILDNSEIKNLIQLNVNSYIKDKKVKGMFNIKVKQNINKHGRLSVNTINAIRLINGEDVKILPIYFDVKRINLLEKAWYFSNTGKIAIKQLKKPEILSLNGEKFYFTDEKEKACLNIYKKYAELTKRSILDFTFIDNENVNLKYIAKELTPDSNENIATKRKVKRDLYKIFGKDFIDINVDKLEYPWFTTTEIQNSTVCQGFKIEGLNKYLILKVGCKNTNWDKNIIAQLKEAKTFETWEKDNRYNRTFVFFNPYIDNFKVKKEYEDYIKVVDSSAIEVYQGTPMIDLNLLQLICEKV
jgi:hypothetical protein